MTKFRRIVLLAATLAFSPLAFAAGKVESIGALTEASVPETIRGALEPAGYRVTLADGSTVELWLRKQAPSAKGDGIYNLAESALVGVIHFSKAAQDYRGQALPAGYYNLRYELQPSDGDHLGTSPTRDFLLLVPPASDTDPEKAYKFEELVALTRRIPPGAAQYARRNRKNRAFCLRRRGRPHRVGCQDEDQLGRGDVRAGGAGLGAAVVLVILGEVPSNARGRVEPPLP